VRLVDGMATEIECVDGWWVIRMPKYVLVLSREQFVDALRRGKWWKRRQARQAYEAKVARTPNVSVP
jgi:hypothetical protein